MLTTVCVEKMETKFVSLKHLPPRCLSACGASCDSAVLLRRKGGNKKCTCSSYTDVFNRCFSTFAKALVQKTLSSQPFASKRWKQDVWVCYADNPLRRQGGNKKYTCSSYIDVFNSVESFGSQNPQLLGCCDFQVQLGPQNASQHAYHLKLA